MEILLIYPTQKLLRFLQDMAVMPFIGRIYQHLVLIQHHTFNRGAADIKTNSHTCFLLKGPIGPPPPVPGSASRGKEN